MKKMGKHSQGRGDSEREGRGRVESPPCVFEEIQASVYDLLAPHTSFLGA